MSRTLLDPQRRVEECVRYFWILKGVSRTAAGCGCFAHFRLTWRRTCEPSTRTVLVMFKECAGLVLLLNCFNENKAAFQRRHTYQPLNQYYAMLFWLLFCTLRSTLIIAIEYTNCLYNSCKISTHSSYDHTLLDFRIGRYIESIFVF